MRSPPGVPMGGSGFDLSSDRDFACPWPEAAVSAVAPNCRINASDMERRPNGEHVLEKKKHYSRNTGQQSDGPSCHWSFSFLRMIRTRPDPNTLLGGRQRP